MAEASPAAQGRGRSSGLLIPRPAIFPPTSFPSQEVGVSHLTPRGPRTQALGLLNADLRPMTLNPQEFLYLGKTSREWARRRTPLVGGPGTHVVFMCRVVGLPFVSLAPSLMQHGAHRTRLMSMPPSRRGQHSGEGDPEVRATALQELKPAAWLSRAST